ncbi:hypothetical protein BZA05DRAFT_462140 [Tricharina praecox]|uniref:uncharacterized protein n=1 Tax=Tricharina praecox TaxID=43433 RepID=UPI0022210806|nr:uncharacterized protein BZA05DRAFT_462140 [Tricharina praecox]KAI5856234.1 hypothetical protein BZA05DRAFT_462140 [Tricharina praecox]
MSTTATITATETEWVPSGDVVANLNFYTPPADGSRPYNIIGSESITKNYGSEPLPVTIHDLRGNESSLSLDKEAFSFHTIPTSLKYNDFADDQKIETVYYSEIKDIVRKHVSDVKEIFIFDHTVRRNTLNALRGPVQVTHIDQTTKSGDARLRHHFPDRADELIRNGTRYQIINVWRPINGVVVSHPLAFADSSTVADDDLVAVAHKYPHYEGETAGVTHKEAQKWWYVSGQKDDEVTLIKCFDSHVGKDGSRRRVPHSAFEHPIVEVSACGVFEFEFC